MFVNHYIYKLTIFWQGFPENTIHLVFQSMEEFVSIIFDLLEVFYNLPWGKVAPEMFGQSCAQGNLSPLDL